MTELDALRAFVANVRHVIDADLPSQSIVDALTTLDSVQTVDVDAGAVLEPPIAAKVFVCPKCGSETPPLVTVRFVAVCGTCGTSLLMMEGGARLAGADDLQYFGELEMALLRKARGAIARPGKRQS